MALIIFHLQDANGSPLGGVIADSSGGAGAWQAVSNACGDTITELDPAPDYVITFSKPGYQTRTIDANLGDCGIVTVGLEKAATPIPPAGGPLPLVPTRAQVCSLQTSLAGLTYHTTQFGDVPAWFYATLTPEDRAGALAVHRAAGDTHIPLPITEAYMEPGTLWPDEMTNGYDYTQDLDGFRAILTEVITAGFFVDVPLGGDGDGSGPGYNVPEGRTYGFQWLMDNLERILTALKGDETTARPDLTPYILFRPGWDGVFYGWGSARTTQQARHEHRSLRWWWRRHHPQPTPYELEEGQICVRDFGALFRRILPAGHLAIEHTPGNIPMGLGPSDYAPGGALQTYDTILSEYHTVHESSYWQVVARMIRPYHRPPDQPAGEDLTPPWYLWPGCPRGEYFYVAFEPTTAGAYEWCRGRCSREAMQKEDAYMRASGVTLTGYPVRW